MIKPLSSNRIKAEALRLGFSACGLAPAEAVDEGISSAFRQWIADGYQAEMAYMQNYEEKRLNPCLLVEGAQTVISVALNYYPETKIPDSEYQIAWYAYGKDYHDVMKAKLTALLAFVQEELRSETGSTAEVTSVATSAPVSTSTSYPDSSLVADTSLASDSTLLSDSTPVSDSSPVSDSTSYPDLPSTNLNARIFCDTAPVLERYWAWRAGLGWIGKNTQLIIPQAGSCFFLGELIINVAADHYDTPQENRCGTCTRCLNACPTKAIEPPFRLNSAKCLSYLTIEYRGDFPLDTGKKMGKKIYGCDECQRACPWNRFAKPTQVDDFHPSDSLLYMRKNDWQHLTEQQYRDLFKGSAVKRAKYQGLVRNIKAVKDF